MDLKTLSLYLNNFDLYGVVSFDQYITKRKEHWENIKRERPTFIDRFDQYDRFSYAKSIITVAYAYTPHDIRSMKVANGYMAKYALTRDYHEVIQKEIVQVIDQLQQEYPNHTFEYTVDNGAIDEKFAGMISGIGSIGKNGLLINQQFGSYFCMGTIVTDLTFESDTQKESKDICKSCNLCIQACPVNALNQYGVDRSRCLSGLLQRKVEVSKEIFPKIDDMMYGCDICADVCPHNKHIQTPKNTHPINVFNSAVDLVWFSELGEEGYQKAYQHSANNWISYPVILRNVIINAVNQKDERVSDVIKKYMSVYKHKEWFVKSCQNALELMEEIV